MRDIRFDKPLVEGIVEKRTNYEQVRKAVDAAQEKGVEIWQANFKIDAEGVKLTQYFPIEV